jgi:membrane-bound lytic murein transglycosylase D
MEFGDMKEKRLNLLQPKNYGSSRMVKLCSLFSIAGLLSLGFFPASAQTRGEAQVISEPITATLDSLTYLLHSNNFERHANFQSPALDFSPTGDLPEFPATLVQQRMDALGSQVPLEYNQYVKGFIDLYGRRKKELTSKILTLSDYYFPVFEEILDRNNLPLEMKYLAVVESALNPRALSWAGASGLWQFIYSTGLNYDLQINSYIDERRDVYKSTEAACRYFKDSYALYGDWLLVIASYNCGPGNVNKAIRKSGGKKNFWAIQKYLPMETRGYVPAFVAVAYVMNYAKEHGIYPMPIELEKVVETVSVNNWVTFEQPTTRRWPIAQLRTASVLCPCMMRKETPTATKSPLIR